MKKSPQLNYEKRSVKRKVLFCFLKAKNCFGNVTFVLRSAPPTTSNIGYIDVHKQDNRIGSEQEVF